VRWSTSSPPARWATCISRPWIHLRSKVRERNSRESRQEGADHRPALERRRQYRAGTARDSGAAPVSDLAAPRDRADGTPVRRLLRTEDRNAELALGIERGDVPCRIQGARARQDGRYSDDGRGHRDGQLLAHRRIDGADPGVGVFLADAKHTNMENYGVRPDILIENAPEDNLSGKDRPARDGCGGDVEGDSVGDITQRRKGRKGKPGGSLRLCVIL